MDATPSEKITTNHYVVKKMVKKHASMLDVSTKATIKCPDDHITLRFYGTTERLACWEIGTVNTLI